MGFRDNLQHVRAERNMTQEQLAMLLGVSRQSVSKWEAERAYPEMDKLLRLCDLFECTLDELVSGDLTDRAPCETSCSAAASVLQDVTGYDQVMCDHAWKIPIGIAIVILGGSLAMLLAGSTLFPGSSYQSYSSILILVGAVCGLAVMLPASARLRNFRRTYPYVEDFYTEDQKSAARMGLSKYLATGIGLIVSGFAAVMIPGIDQWLSSAVLLFFLAIGVFCIVRGCLMNARCEVSRYNRKALCCLDDAKLGELNNEDLRTCAREARRERSACIVVLSVATAVGLLLLFVPVFHAQRWFWIAWLVGAVLCVAVRAVFSIRRSG